VVLHKIGEGAMGVVLAAYDQLLDRKVALKLLRADIDDSERGMHHRMRREAQAMARLSHPNVAQVYEAGEVDGQLFLAMEFIEGVTLRVVDERSARGLAGGAAGAPAGRARPRRGPRRRADAPRLQAGERDRRQTTAASACWTSGCRAGAATGRARRSTITRKNLADIGVTAAGSMLGTPRTCHPSSSAATRPTPAAISSASARRCGRGCTAGVRSRAATSASCGRTCSPASSSPPPEPGPGARPGCGRSSSAGSRSAAKDRWPEHGGAARRARVRPPARPPTLGRRRARGVCDRRRGFGVAAYRNAEARRRATVAELLAGVWDAPQRTALAEAVRATSVDYAETILASPRATSTATATA
jgi:hypothetical protein